MRRALAFCLVTLSGCAHPVLLRDLSAGVHVTYSTRARDVVATLDLTARPLPPPVAARDVSLGEPTIGASRLDTCRSRYGLCRFENAAIAAALTTHRSTVP
jgi:hypothetical protein